MSTSLERDVETTPEGARTATRTLVVAERVEAADGVVALTLRAADDRPLPTWHPGAHVDLILPNGVTRQYSLCSDPADESSWRVGVLREPESRGGSSWLHDNAVAGTRLEASDPRNNFELVEAGEYLFIGGGIGITPLLPMIAEAHRRGADWRLAYGGRTAASMAFVGELHPHGERVELCAQEVHGLLDLPRLLAEPREGVAIYCCGPEPLLAAVEEACAGWPKGTLHVERFAPRPGALDGVAEAFEVELAASGMTLTIGPEQSIAEAVEAAGIDIPTSCREGTCGTCETAVIEGVPDHRDSYLTEDEREDGETMMICCSRAAPGTRLVLDL